MLLLRKRYIAGLALSLLLALVAIWLNRIAHPSQEKVITDAEERLKDLDARMSGLVSGLLQSDSSVSLDRICPRSQREAEGLSLYLREQGWLTRWSDNKPDFINLPPDSLQDGRLLRLPNGWYYLRTAGKGTKTAFVLLLVRNAFAYENQYLQNDFNPVLGIPVAAREVPEGGRVLRGPSGETWFRLHWDVQLGADPVALLLFLAAFLLFSGCATALALSYPARQGVAVGLALVALRLLTHTVHLPGFLYASELFSPRHYASSWMFNSLGDLLLNGWLACCLAWILFRRFPRNERFHPVTTLSGLLPVAALFYGMQDLLHGLVLNSRISFDVAELATLDRFTLFAGATIVLWMAALSLVLVALYRRLLPYRFGDAQGFTLLLLLSVFTSVCLMRFNADKELETRKLLAQKIDARQDHVAEYLLAEQLKRMQTDPVLLQLPDLPINRVEAIRNHLSTYYLTGYLSKFDLRVRVFGRDGGQSDTSDVRTIFDFRRAAEEMGRRAMTPDLYYLSDESGQLSYLAFVRLQRDTTFHDLVLSLDARFFPAGTGFPELFISGIARESRFPEHYALARYNRHALVFEYGNYSYAFSDREFGNGSDDFVSVETNGYDHLLYRPSEGTLIVVSRPAVTTFQSLTLFSWVFSFFGIVLSSGWLIGRLWKRNKPVRATLTRRIQISVFSLVVLSFMAIGTGTILYIQRKYATDQRQSISGQVNGLWLLLTENAAIGSPLSGTSPLPLEPVLSRIAVNTNIDFNIYDERGQLYYSSQPRIFEQGIVSSRMNPEALVELQENHRTQYIHRESVGKLRYVAAYAPFTDGKGRITGFLNLPYFEKQNELNQEISGFLSALLNIYVLLFALAVLVTLLISSRITQPLLLIQEKLAGIRLGKRNEQIAYTGTDEIGALVNEYNRMVSELASSAEKLAQSERESAWREMARQVAHEIKNPLTPMKLSVQHLQRTATEEGKSDPAQVKRVTATLLQQIDTLANIATAFSDFARMPAAKKERVDLRNIVRQTTDLFADLPGLTIRCDLPDAECVVLADKDQLTRVFSNLLKNATQAIPEGRPGEIRVRLHAEEDGWEVVVEDNGIGIPGDRYDKIFVPNFTTKSGGTGLGLAMVKNIVQQSDGRVRFESRDGEWTRFYVWLPQAPDESVS